MHSLIERPNAESTQVINERLGMTALFGGAVAPSAPPILRVECFSPKAQRRSAF
jgi:hypothetical protein